MFITAGDAQDIAVTPMTSNSVKLSWMTSFNFKDSISQLVCVPRVLQLPFEPEFTTSSEEVISVHASFTGAAILWGLQCSTTYVCTLSAEDSIVEKSVQVQTVGK